MESCSCSELPPCTGVTVLPCPSQSFLGAETTRKSLEWQFGDSSSTTRAALEGISALLLSAVTVISTEQGKIPGQLG